MRAYILSIGSELIQGHLTDTNATFLAQGLSALGIELLHVIQVGDDLPRLTETLRRAVTDADLVVCTGGIGPTDDDLTREAIAALVGETPRVDPELLDQIRAFFAGRGLTMPEGNAKQAWTIESAEILVNPVGTAPGWFVQHATTVFVAMPGVPREMHRMWREQAVPRLSPLLPVRVSRSINFRTLGIGESAAAQLLGALTRLESPAVGTYAKDDGVHIRLTATASTESEVTSLLEPTAVEVRHRLSEWIYAEDERPLATVLADLLRQRAMTIGIVEIGGGGRFGSLLLSEASAEGSLGGMLTLPMKPGQSAKAAAAEARLRFGSAVGVGIVVEATPTEQRLHEGSVVVAVEMAGSSTEEQFPIRATFVEIQRRAGLHAADVVRRRLLAIAGDA